MTRELNWPGAFNARDLGGIEIAGGVIPTRVLFRSGQPQAWEPQAFDEAYEDGVRRIFDLRDPSEPHPADTPTGLPDTGRVLYSFVPVEDPANEEFRARFQPYMNHTSGYSDFMRLFHTRVVDAAQKVLEAGDGTLVCCSAGRDRTGLVTGLVLRALGASTAAIAEEDALAVRAINAHQLVRKKPHPYERWVPDDELAQVIEQRKDALVAFLESQPEIAQLRAPAERLRHHWFGVKAL